MSNHFSSQPASSGGSPSSELGLYIHLPFCRTKCTYCAFVSGSPRSEEEIDRYVEALLVHLAAGADRARGRALTTVFFGGGTPSLLGPARMERILAAIHEGYALTPGAEITIEANPESGTRDLFERLTPLGVNRVSLGVQSFHDDELQWLGRVHSVAGVDRALESARAAGIDNVSLDLIFGLPGQSLDRWRETLERALARDPMHLSAYALGFEEGTLLDRLREQGKVSPACDEEYEAMYDAMRERLAEAGYGQYELSSWSRPGRACRHNLIYWRRDEYLAFGVSAHGWYGGLRYGLIRDPRKYMTIIEDNRCMVGADPFWEGLLDERHSLSSDEAASDAMIFGLRMTRGVDAASFSRRYGYAPAERWGETIARLRDRGLLEADAGSVRLTPRAYFISNEALHHFLD